VVNNHSTCKSDISKSNILLWFDKVSLAPPQIRFAVVKSSLSIVNADNTRNRTSSPIGRRRGDAAANQDRQKKTKKQKTLTVALGVSLTDSASVPG